MKAYAIDGRRERNVKGGVNEIGRLYSQRVSSIATLGVFYGAHFKSYKTFVYSGSCNCIAYNCNQQKVNENTKKKKKTADCENAFGKFRFFLCRACLIVQNIVYSYTFCYNRGNIRNFSVFFVRILIMSCNWRVNHFRAYQISRYKLLELSNFTLQFFSFIQFRLFPRFFRLSFYCIRYSLMKNASNIRK